MNTMQAFALKKCFKFVQCTLNSVHQQIIIYCQQLIISVNTKIIVAPPNLNFPCISEQLIFNLP